MPFAVLLQCDKLIAVNDHWVENRAIFREKSKIFFSPNANDIADFTMETKYFYIDNIVACYNGVVYKYFQNFDEAKMFVEQRPRRLHFTDFFPITNGPIVEYIDLTSEVRNAPANTSRSGPSMAASITPQVESKDEPQNTIAEMEIDPIKSIQTNGSPVSLTQSVLVKEILEGDVGTSASLGASTSQKDKNSTLGIKSSQPQAETRDEPQNTIPKMEIDPITSIQTNGSPVSLTQSVLVKEILEGDVGTSASLGAGTSQKANNSAFGIKTSPPKAETGNEPQNTIPKMEIDPITSIQTNGSPVSLTQSVSVEEILQGDVGTSARLGASTTQKANDCASGIKTSPPRVETKRENYVPDGAT